LTSKRIRRWILPASILILAAILLATWFYLNRNLRPETLFPPNNSGASITILSPDDRGRYPADAAIPIQISVSHDNPLSSLELWVDGIQVETYQPAGEDGPFDVHQFYWTPTRQGNIRILARATDSAGKSTTSNPILIEIIEPAGARLVSPDDSDTTISEVIFPGLSELSAPPNIPDLPQTSLQDLAPGKPLTSDLSLWLGSRFQANASSPQAPELTYSLEDCQTTLIITDRSDDELGIFIYRSGPGSSSFQRVAELQNPAGTGAFGYTDPNPAGGAIYYAAAFNGAGENPSVPVQIPDSDPSCPGSGDGGSADLPAPEELEILDLAYFYYSFDGGGYRRYPSDPEDFLTPSEYPTSLSAVVKGLTSTSSAMARQADLVVWGWSGGALVNLGAFQLEIDNSHLQVCNLGTGCTGDVAGGFRSTFGELANDAEDQMREFYWATNAPGTSAVLWQISTSPFSADFSPHPYRLVAAGCSEGGSRGSFLVDFKDLDAYLPARSACGGFSQPWMEFSEFGWEQSLFPGLETHYYIRFTPFSGNQPAGKPSNTVEILAKPGESVIEPIIVDHLPEIYQVEVVDFTPIKKMDPRYWGCVSITGLDYNAIWDYYRSLFPANITDTMIDQFAGTTYDEMNYAVQNNLIVCPAPYDGSSGSGSVLSEWGSMLVESLKEIWEDVVSAFNALKAGIVDQVANAISKLGIPCDAECRAGLKLGLEIGMTYFTGIPPNLPSYEQLKNQGLDYLVEMAAAEAGIPCPEQCQEILREGLEDVIDAAAQNNAQPGCVGEDWANALGKHSLCLPPGVETAAVPEGVSEPARAVIRVSRVGQEPPGQYQYDSQPAYVLNVQFTGVNTALSGTTIPYTYSYWNNGSRKFFILEAPISRLQNDVFDSQSVPIPPLAPGESITIPLSLIPHTYYIPEHLHSLTIELNARNLEIEDVGGVGGSRGTMFDWLCLHNGAEIKIDASVSCLSVPNGLIGSTSPDENSELVPCGSDAQPYFYQETSDPCYP